MSQTKRVGYNNFLPNGDEIVETATWYGHAAEFDETASLSELAAAEWIEVMLPLKHSGWTEQRALRKLIDREEPIIINGAAGPVRWKPKALFWRVWILKPASRHNRKNQDWESWTAAPGPTLHELDPDGGMLRLAKQFADAFKAELMRYTLDPQDKRPLIDGGIADPRG